MKWLQLLQKFPIKRLAGPVLVLMVLGMMVLPLPPLVLDLFFTFNIAIAIIVLMVTLYTTEPLQFSVFPSVLLFSTLLRLSLNVASTRVVLLEGHTGPGAAGHVIEAFGNFLIGGNYAVGIIVFIILIIINFVVITKGAGRIAEVGARFTLDAMPGKQMAIDADLNAGLIGEEDARKRRAAISQEADFFGSMDGASKFVRGDAVAGILIMVINIVGGLVVGMVQHDLDFELAAKTYTLLTIGDGLVAQIPALIISTAAGVAVSRVGDDKDVSEQLIGQMFNQPIVLYITAGVLGILGLIPGMPHVAFLFIAGTIGGLAWWIEERDRRDSAKAAVAPPPPAPVETVEVGWHDVAPVDIIGLEVGYRLISLVDRNQDGELLKRIRGLRKKMAQDVGFLAPAVHIRDNLELRPNTYRILLKGVEIATGESYPGQYLAINPGQVSGHIPGNATRDPAFGLPAIWIEASNRETAQALGYTVVDASTVIGTHLSSLLNQHSAELLGREEVQQLLDHVKTEYPKLIEELVPKVIPLGTLHRVLQNLLDDGLHIRDIRSIIEALADQVSKTTDLDELTSAVRGVLGRAICFQWFGAMDEYPVITLEPSLENLLLQATQSKGNESAGLEPGLAERLLREASQLAQRQEDMGQAAVLIVPGPLRTLLARFFKRPAPQLKVVAHQEIPENKSIKVVAVLGGQGV